MLSRRSREDEKRQLESAKWESSGTLGDKPFQKRQEGRSHTHMRLERARLGMTWVHVCCVCFCNAGSCVGTGPMSVQLLVHMEGFSLSMLFCVSA